ncbi:MAG: imelysin family protein [Bacteroidota bacterium]
MKFLNYIFIGLMTLVVVTGIVGCGNDDDMTMNPVEDDFDRKAMLTFWADDIIIPGYDNYLSAMDDLDAAVSSFYDAPEQANLDALRMAWLEAYKKWQKISMFAIGKAESEDLRGFTNTFPTDVDLIMESINGDIYNLDLPSNRKAQGFPALDYLLFGTANQDSEIIALLTEDKYKNYFLDIIAQMDGKATAVTEDWKNGYREEFINNNGSSETASVDKMVNDFVMYYEAFLRSGKIGFPAGTVSGQALPGNVEAPYSGIYSRTLLNEALDAVQDFFNGISTIDGSQGQSLSAYINSLEEMLEEDQKGLVADVNDQWGVARSLIEGLNENLRQQVEDDNIKMLFVYDELQKVVPLIKVDMYQILSVKLDFFDGDGDGA